MVWYLIGNALLATLLIYVGWRIFAALVWLALPKGLRAFYREDTSELAGNLETLARLYRKGALTNEEFNAAKARLLLAERYPKRRGEPTMPSP